MRLHLMACAIALVSASCASDEDAPVQPFDAARYAGRLRAANLLQAKDCSPNQSEVAKEIRASGVPPSNYTAAAANSFHAGFSEWYALANRPDHSPQACQVLRDNPDYALLFKPADPAPTRSASRRGERAKPAQPAYCPAGYLKAKVDSDWSIARDAIKQDCQKGDSLIIPAFASGLIATVCDTGKPISRINEDVVCTLGAIRETRSTR